VRYESYPLWGATSVKTQVILSQETTTTKPSVARPAPARRGLECLRENSTDELSPEGTVEVG